MVLLHHVALRNRIDLSNVSDDHSKYLDIPMNKLVMNVLLPSQLDYEKMISHYAVLVSRVSVSKLQFFERAFDDFVKHISHKYSKEMSKKSETVRLNM